MRYRILWAALTALAVSFLCSAANAGPSAADALLGGSPIVDLRARFEGVDDQSKIHFGTAVTVRARLGYETAAWHGFSLSGDVDLVGAAVDDYNSTRNGKTTYPTVGDPALATLNRLQLSYVSPFDTRIVVGRQRLLFGDQRFIGNSGWRQHEQTFDALTLVNSTVKNLTLTYAYIDRVNRVFGPDDPKPATGPAGHFGSNSHLFNAVYIGVLGLKLEGYAYLLDLDQRGPAPAMFATSKLSTATYGARGEYKTTLADSLTGQINAAFAQQQDYAHNPLTFNLDYWLIEGGLSYQGFSATAGYESLGGNGKIGFSTPLASLHPFNGWADMFLTTPVNGLDDSYAKGSYAIPDVLGMTSLTGAVAYHDYKADKTGIGIGSEWDASLELAVDRHTSLQASIAEYGKGGIGFGGFHDKTITWFQIAYKY